ncbi:MAG: hypothetical protein ABEI57_00215 [Halapricum sp.]
MPTTKQLRPHGDRNVIPEDVSPKSEIEHDECPIDEFTLSHMRASSTDE